MQQEAEEMQRAEDEEHQRITNTRVVGFMVKRTRDSAEETAVPASSLAVPSGDIGNSRDVSVSNRVAQANQMVASVNIELAREVLRLEAENAGLRDRNAVLETDDSHIIELPMQIETSRPVRAEIGSTVGARSEDGGGRYLGNFNEVEGTAEGLTRDKIESDDSELEDTK